MRIGDLIHMFFNGQYMLRILPELGKGLLVTVEIAALSLALGVGLGLVLAVIRVAISRKTTPWPIRLLNYPLVFYVDSMRSIPPLVTLVVVYFALPYLGIYIPDFPCRDRSCSSWAS